MPNTLLSKRYFEPGKIPLLVLEAKHGDKPIAAHSHDFIELVLFAEGSSIHEYADKHYTLTPGDVFVIHPGEPHAYVLNKKARLFNILFLPEVLNPDLPYLQRLEGFFDLIMVEPFFRSETGFRSKVQLDTPTRLRVQELILEIKRELDKKQPGYEAAARAMLIQLLVQIARFRTLSIREAQTADSEEASEKRALVRDCINYIEEHYPDEIRLERLADRAYLSPEYFSKIFKRLTSKTPIEFINTVRVDKAKQLLASSTLPVTDIAYRIGFHDANYFSRQFKKSTGVTPGDYRKQAVQ